MIKEQGRGENTIRGFNNNFGGFDITSGGWKYDTFGPDITNGYVFATEGGTKRRKAFVSFKSLEAFVKNITSKFQEKGFALADTADKSASTWYSKWNGYGARTLWEGNVDGRKEKYKTVADYDKAVLSNFKGCYEKALAAVNSLGSK